MLAPCTSYTVSHPLYILLLLISLNICRYSRYGKPMSIPVIFYRSLGNTFMDGQLWYANTTYSKIRKLFYSYCICSYFVWHRFGRTNTARLLELKGYSSSGSKWDISCFCVNDLPSQQHLDDPFEQRFKSLVEANLANEFVVS